MGSSSLTFYTFTIALTVVFLLLVPHSMIFLHFSFTPFEIYFNLFYVTTVERYAQVNNLFYAIYCFIWRLFNILFQALGATYYVGPAGNDTSTGISSRTAWKTIQHAADTVVAGNNQSHNKYLRSFIIEFFFFFFFSAYNTPP
jgi:hypothetical protein